MAGASHKVAGVFPLPLSFLTYRVRMYETETHINGLPLPPDLLAQIHAGRWKFPEDLTAVKYTFPAWQVALTHTSGFMLYMLDTIERENMSWIEEKDPMFIGAPDTTKTPGDIDPNLSLLIGDLGWGSEQPIALDYPCSLKSTRVLTLEWSDDRQNNRWVEIVPNI